MACLTIEVHLTIGHVENVIARQAVRLPKEFQFSPYACSHAPHGIRSGCPELRQPLAPASEPPWFFGPWLICLEGLRDERYDVPRAP